MVHSSYYASAQRAGVLSRAEPFFVLGVHESSKAHELVAHAVLCGARAIVVEWGNAKAMTTFGCNQLSEGVSYFFVRSVKDTLARWNATPVAIEADSSL